MINKDRNFFQYKSGDLVYIISLNTNQLRTSSRKVAIKYIGPLVVYKIIDPQNYLLMPLYSKILRDLFEHMRLKPAIIRTSQGNVHNLPHLKQVINISITIQETMWHMAQMKECFCSSLKVWWPYFTWLGSVHLDGAVLYFNYFSQCHHVVIV